MSQHEQIVMPGVLPEPVSPEEQMGYTMALHNQYAQSNDFLVSKFLDGTNPMSTADLGVTPNDNVNADLMIEAQRKIRILSDIVDVVDKDDPSVRYTVGRPQRGSMYFGQDVGLAVTLKTSLTVKSPAVLQLTLFRGSLPENMQASFDAKAVQLKQQTEAAAAAHTAKLATQQAAKQAETQAFIEAVTANNPKPLTTRQKLGKAATHLFKESTKGKYNS
jgi:hypothetical protein